MSSISCLSYLCLSVRSRPTHEGDSINDDGEVLGEDGLDAVLVGRKFEDVDTEAADRGHQGQVLGARKVQVDQMARVVGLKREIEIKRYIEMSRPD